MCHFDNVSRQGVQLAVPDLETLMNRGLSAGLLYPVHSRLPACLDGEVEFENLGIMSN